MRATPSATQTEEPPVETRTEQPAVRPQPVRRTRMAPWRVITLGPQDLVTARPRPVVLPAPRSAYPPQDLFSASLLESNVAGRTRLRLHFIASIFAHCVAIVALIVLPLYFTESIGLGKFSPVYLLTAPPPPPPPPPALVAARAQAVPRRVPMAPPKLLSPTVIPERVAMLTEKAPPEDLGAVDTGVAGGVPGGVPGGIPGGILGGQMGGTVGAIISSGSTTPPPPAPAAATHRTPLQVGGNVKPPREIFTPPPIYPPLARQARIEGTVLLDAVIDTSGNVVEAKVISGPLLLVPAALEAVQKWKYEPTYLNGEPIPLRLRVTVIFELSR